MESLEGLFHLLYLLHYLLHGIPVLEDSWSPSNEGLFSIYIKVYLIHQRQNGGSSVHCLENPLDRR